MLFVIIVRILDFNENLLEFGHSSDALLEEGTGQVLLGDSELIGLGNLVHVGLWLIDLDEGLKDVDDSSWHITVYFFNFLIS